MVNSEKQERGDDEDVIMERKNEALKKMMNTPHETQKEMMNTPHETQKGAYPLGARNIFTLCWLTFLKQKVKCREPQLQPYL